MLSVSVVREKNPTVDLPLITITFVEQKDTCMFEPKYTLKAGRIFWLGQSKVSLFEVIILIFDNNQHPDQEREKQAIARVQADLDFTKTEVTRLEEENKILMSMAGSYKLNWMAAERSLTLAEREIEEDSSYWGESMCFSQPRVYRESPPRRIE